MRVSTVEDKLAVFQQLWKGHCEDVLLSLLGKG